MTSNPVVASRNKWLTTTVGVVAGIACVATLVGFVWLPSEQVGTRFGGAWDAICSAAGLTHLSPSSEPVVQAAYETTRVEASTDNLRGATVQSIGRGATLALRCTMCHGAQGISQADAPNLAGQFSTVVYKQLVDFQTGARTSAVMAPLVTDLSQQNLHDLAVYYASLPRATGRSPSGTPPRIVADGSPMRGIAPCGACHGELASKPGAPWLEGQPTSYLRAQLQAFASGDRHNDISEQMRNVARGMTPAEMTEASRFYAGRPSFQSVSAAKAP